MRAFGVVLQPQEVFADVHLRREADVVVDKLLAERECFRAAHREQFDLVAEMLEVGGGEDAESAGKVRNEDRAGLLVLFLEFDGEERAFRLGWERNLSPCADGFDKALDADADRASGVAFVELQHQEFLHGDFVQHPVHFVGENRVVSATEADDLHEFERGILGGEHRRPEHSHVERVLDFHPGVPIDVLVEDPGKRFRREDGDSHPREMLRNVVVDERVRMVGTPGEAYREVALFSDVFENLSAFFCECRAKSRKRLFALGHRLVENLFGNTPEVVEVVHRLLAAQLHVCPVERGLDHRNPVAVFRVIRIAADVGISLHDGAYGSRLELRVIARQGDHHREEDAIDLLVDEIENVTVDELCREANRVACDALESAFKELVVALTADDDRVAERGEERFPVGKARPEFERPRNADGLSRLREELFRRVVLD